jgi:hypothetical protein
MGGSPFPTRPESGSGNPPIRPGNGNRGPDWPQIGKSGITLRVSTPEYALSEHDPQWAPLE